MEGGIIAKINGYYRIWVVILVFFGTFVAYVLRVNINFAIVYMMNAPDGLCKNASDIGYSTSQQLSLSISP